MPARGRQAVDAKGKDAGVTLALFYNQRTGDGYGAWFVDL
tara:strand:+ start:1037 stop:1156 length:120 start_codon:yes stop_codon:yes gene_type:complete